MGGIRCRIDPTDPSGNALPGHDDGTSTTQGTPHSGPSWAVDLDGWLCSRAAFEVAADRGHSALVAALSSEGAAGLTALVGEFAFAAWNPALRLLVAARDPLASKPLFWSWDGTRLVVASTARDVVELGRVPPRPDEGAIAELLCQRPETVDSTVWEGVHRLACGNALVFDAGSGRLRTVIFWQPSTGALPGFVDDAVREAVWRAVRRRARPGETIACELSGGLDSTTVLGVARELGIDVRPYSSVYPGLACDETLFIEASLAFHDLKGRLLDSSPPTIEERRRCVKEHWLLGDYMLSAEESRRAAAADGCDVIFSGDFGDEVLGGFCAHAESDALHRRQVSALRHLVVGPHRRSLASFAYRDRLRWLLGSEVRRRWQPPPPAWVSPSLTRRVALADRFAEAERRPPVGSPSFRWMASVLTGWWTQSRSDLGTVDIAPGADMRYPLGDIQLVELSLRIPQDVKTTPLDNRHLHRRLFADVLPPAVQSRRDAADFSALIHTHLAAGPDLLAGTPAVVDLGWVDPVGLAQLRADVLAARPTLAWTPLLWVYATITELELWVTELVL